jgi:hypothetical protein
MECAYIVLILFFSRAHDRSREPCPLIDSQGRIFAVLAGQPRDPSYKLSVAAAFTAIMQEGTAAQFPASMRHHRRGLFAAINVGLTFGKGQKAPTWLLPTDYAAMAQRLLANQHVGRMATFASCWWFYFIRVWRLIFVSQLPLRYGRLDFMNITARKMQSYASTFHSYHACSPTPFFLVPPSTLGPTSGRFGIATFKMYPLGGVPFNPPEISMQPRAATLFCGS